MTFLMKKMTGKRFKPLSWVFKFKEEVEIFMEFAD